eukprot:3492687-Amphidinium_carterae.1
MMRSVNVEGVGSGVQTTRWCKSVPGAVVDRDGKCHRVSFTAPLLEQSNIPALLGLRSLRAKRAILDMGKNVLYLPGQAEVEVVSSPGTLAFDLVESSSGHLLLPFSQFARSKANLSRDHDDHHIAFQANYLEEETNVENNERTNRWRCKGTPVSSEPPPSAVQP